QTAPGQAPAAAGALNPAPDQTPRPAQEAPNFQMAEGILATVNDSVITGFDLRQRMLLLIAMTQVQPTAENLPAIQQQALNSLIDERLQAQEISKYETDGPLVSNADVDQEIAAMAQDVGT